MGFRSGEYGQVKHASSGGAEEPVDVGGLVGADVVEHDDVAGLQLAKEDALEEGLEDLGRAFDVIDVT